MHHGQHPIYNRKPLTNTDTIKLRGEIIFIPTNETHAAGDAHVLEPILRTTSINLYLWDEKLVLSGRQILQWRCSHHFKVVIRREGHTVPLLETLLEFDPTPDTSWRTLRAEVDIPIKIHWEEKICVEISSESEMPVYDVRGVMVSYKEMKVYFMAFGNTKENGPSMIHIYKDEEWNKDWEILAGFGLDQSLMTGLEEL